MGGYIACTGQTADHYSLGLIVCLVALAACGCAVYVAEVAIGGEGFAVAGRGASLIRDRQHRL